MPVTMPPSTPVAYAIERPAPTRADGVADRLIASVARTREAIAARSPALPGNAIAIPAIDASSVAVSPLDRDLLAASVSAAASWRLADAPAAGVSSYVGQRVALAVSYAQAGRAMSEGTLDSSRASELRCRMVAVVFDPRAGAAVAGGEQAAEASRRAIPASVVQECASVVQKYRATSVGSPARNTAQMAMASRGRGV